MMYVILNDNYQVLAQDNDKEKLKKTIELFMKQHEDKEIVEIEDTEIGYDNNTYVKGHTPVPPEEIAKENVRSYRDRLLLNSDKWGVADRPQTPDVLSHKEWRQYLRDYTGTQNWWLKNPMTYEEWSNE